MPAAVECGAGAVSGKRPALIRSAHREAGISVSNSAAFRRTCAADRAPRQAVATAGCPRGNWAAAAGSGTPWLSHMSAMRFARSTNSADAGR